MREFRGYPVQPRRIEVAEHAFELIAPANYERLLDDARAVERFERDEYLPYWADLWPASVMLAREVALWGPAKSPSPSVLELGCGLGLVSLVASRLGYAVVASDYDEDALAFMEENARRNRIPAPTARHVDWRVVYPDLRFDCILAADVLYETRSLRPVAEFVAGHLNAGGFALISDPDRSTANDFPAVARHCDLSVETTPAEAISTDDVKPVSGRVFRLQIKS